MKNVRLIFMVILLGVGMLYPSITWAQSSSGISTMLSEGFDLLAQGKIDQSQKIYEEVLKKDPGNPVALNNLGVIMTKKGNFRQAMDYMNQALIKAKGKKVSFKQVCSIEGVCAAFNLTEGGFGDQDLYDAINFNITVLKLNMPQSQGRK